MSKFCIDFNLEESEKVKQWRDRHPYINVTQFLKSLFFREINQDTKEFKQRIKYEL